LSAGISTVAARISSLRPTKAFRANVATLFGCCAKDGLQNKATNKKVHAGFFIKKICNYFRLQPPGRKRRELRVGMRSNNYTVTWSKLRQSSLSTVAGETRFALDERRRK
jgi:hypothetical protein